MKLFVITLFFLFFIFSFSSCRKEKKDPCIGVTCLHYGVCVDGTCDCPPGYVGERCELRLDPCQDVTCMNGGVCVDGTCDCPPGYIGQSCEVYSPCSGVNCENDGYCINGTCICPPGYGGVDCSTILTPESMTITKVVVTNYPMTNGGSGWDISGAGGPDVYFKFQKRSNRSIEFISATKHNVSGQNLVYTLSTPYTVYSPTAHWVIQLWDEDFSSNDYMIGGYFTPSDFAYNYGSGFTDVFTVNWTAGMTVKFYVTWGF